MVGVTGGDDMVAADINDLLLYLPRWYVKAGSTSRNTTTTPADDPDLAGIALEVGTFEIQMNLYFTMSTTNTQKLRTLWGFTGTWGTTIRTCHGPGSAATTGPDDCASVNVRGYTTDTQSADYGGSTSGAYSAVTEIAMDVDVSVAGNLSLKWSQAASSGNNTNLNSPSAIRVTRKRS